MVLIPIRVRFRGAPCQADAPGKRVIPVELRIWRIILRSGKASVRIRQHYVEIGELLHRIVILLRVIGRAKVGEYRARNHSVSRFQVHGLPPADLPQRKSEAVHAGINLDVDGKILHAVASGLADEGLEAGIRGYRFPAQGCR